MAKEARDIVTVHGGNAQSVKYMDERHYNSQQNKKSNGHSTATAASMRTIMGMLGAFFMCRRW